MINYATTLALLNILPGMLDNFQANCFDPISILQNGIVNVAKKDYSPRYLQLKS